MVRFDVGRVARTRFNDVRVERSLDQELRPFIASACSKFTSDFFKDANEQFANDLALALWVRDPRQGFEVAVFSSHVNEVHLEVLTEGGVDLVAFAFAHEAGVDEHTGQLIANGFVHERCSNRRVDAARQCAEHLLRADLGLDGCDLSFNDGRMGPRSRQRTHVVQEALNQVLAVDGVLDFWVELHAIGPTVRVAKERNGCIFTRGQHLDVVWQFGDGVAVAHPDVGNLGKINREGRVLMDGHGAAAIATSPRCFNRATQGLGQQLCAVANAEDGNPELKDRRVKAWCTFGVDRTRPTGQDDALGPFGLDFSSSDGGANNLGVHPSFANPTSNQLRILRTEVNNENDVGQCPMPTFCERWSCLPSVCSAGAIMTSAFWNSLTVS